MKFSGFLRDYRPAPFDWATANCCHFAAAWVEYKTGRNPMAHLAITESKTAALRLIVELGGTLRAAWSARLESEPILATFAQVGDVVLFESRNAVAVCAGSVAACVEEGGAFAFLPMSEAACAWRIK